MSVETRAAIEPLRLTLNTDHHTWTYRSHEEKIAIVEDVMKRIFISYRRSDTAVEAERLHNELSAYFGPVTVFQDQSDIEPGRDYREVLSSVLQESQSLLAIIGPTWLDCTAADGRRRIDLPEDWVRLEIAAGLERRIRVVPLLVRGAAMPTVDQLPEELKDFAYREATALRDTQWMEDLFELMRYLDEADPVRERAKALYQMYESAKPRHYMYIRAFPAGKGFPYSDMEFGRSFASLHRGTLHDLVRRYCELPRARFANDLRPYLQQLQDRDTALLDDETFQSLLTTAAGEDPEMLRVQDREFDRAFWVPSVREAASIGISTGLGTAVIFDTITELGMGRWRRLKEETSKRLDGTPITGIEEGEWIDMLLQQRRDSTRHMGSERRVEHLLKLVHDDNWKLEPPIDVFGKRMT